MNHSFQQGVASFRSRVPLERHRFLTIIRKYAVMGVILLVIIISFERRVNSVYHKLNDRITNLTTIETNEKIRHEESEHNITLQLHNITDVSDEILALKIELMDQNKEIVKLTNMVEFQINTTVKELNATVEQVQQNVQQQVQQVNENVSSQNSLMAYQFAGTFAILGSLISFWHMAAHIRKFNEPTVQRKIIAIMWMIPIYSVSSWLGLVFVTAQGYLQVFKDIYEAYAIYTFLSFLIAILGRGDREAVITLLAQNADHLKPPLRFRVWSKREVYASARHKAEAVLDQCQFFTLQFVLLRPITTVVIVISDAIHETRWDPKYPQFYTMMVVNISIFFAFTGLVRFYHVVKNDLNWCSPFSKFLCIKGVVFMTFWQGIVISFIAHSVYKTDAAMEGGEYSATEWSKQAQSFLVCLEMFLFAIVHCFVFPTEEWEPGYQEREKRKIKGRFGDSLALRDFVKDVKLVMRSRKGKRGKMIKLPQRDDGGPNSPSGGGTRENGNSLVLDDEDDIDIDWSQGWSRIEKYLTIVEEAGSSEDEGDIILDSNGSRSDLHLSVEEDARARTGISTTTSQRTSVMEERRNPLEDDEQRKGPHEIELV